MQRKGTNMEKEFRILCEECDGETVVVTFDNENVEFCPLCGRRTEAVEAEED
jgi:rRNA maturation endonuclease Nob1